MEDVAARWPDHFVAWRARDPAWLIPDGESGNSTDRTITVRLAAIVRAHAGARPRWSPTAASSDAAYRAARSLSWTRRASIDAQAPRSIACRKHAGERRCGRQRRGTDAGDHRLFATTRICCTTRPTRLPASS